MSAARTLEQIQVQIAVATSLEEKYGTNNPDKTYEQGVVDALLWILGGQEPHSHVMPNTAEQLTDAEYENERLVLVANQSPALAAMVRDTLLEMDNYQEPHHAIWLGSFEEGRPRTQVQLVITQNPNLWIDED